MSVEISLLTSELVLRDLLQNNALNIARLKELICNKVRFSVHLIPMKFLARA